VRWSRVGACCVLLCLWLAALVPRARAETMRLEPLLRLVTQEPAQAVAVDAQRHRLLVAQGEFVREYVLVSAGVVVPATSAPARLLGLAVDMVVDGGDVFVATQRAVCAFEAAQPDVVLCRAGVWATGLDVAGDHVYVTVEDWDHNACGLWVMDRQLLLQNQWLEHCWDGDLVRGYSDVAAHGSQAYVAAWGGGGFSGYSNGAVGLLDVAQPRRPLWRGTSYCLSGLPSQVTFSGGLAYVSRETDGYTPYLRPGLTLLQERGDRLVLAGALDTAHDLTSLALAGRYVLAGDGSGRVWAIDVSDASRPRAVAWLDTSFAVQDLAVSGAEVYVAQGEGGLAVLQMVEVPEPTPTPPLQSAEGTLTRVQFSICQAGETHVLPESNVYLFSDYVPLRPYEGRYVQVWGWEVESPECRLLNVTAIVELRATPAPRPPQLYLPLMCRG